MTANIALVGGRGYVGESLLQLLRQHSTADLAWISSRSLAGQSVQSVFPDLSTEKYFECLSPAEAANRPADVVVLAMPNGAAADYVAAMCPAQKIVDVSADYRFDDAWCYGLPEVHRDRIRHSNRISNPGCYATTTQLALTPLLQILDGIPRAFGVSGYSGAGRTPSPRNDPERLADNLAPYSLSGHLHELEISHQLGHTVRFMPHVAAFFRGISVTVSASLAHAVDEDFLYELFDHFYAGDDMIRISRSIPEVRDVAGTPLTAIGGFTVDQRDHRHVTVVAVLDNLLKGAASQALQNINLMLGLDEFDGIAV